MEQLCEFSRNLVNKMMVRNRKKQKEAFRTWITDELKNRGLDARAETNQYLMKNRNIIVGDVEQCRVILTAHYDTPFTLPFPNFITPKNLFFSLGYQVLLALVLLFVPTVATGLFCTVLQLNSEMSFFLWLILIYITIGCLFLVPNKNNYNDNTSGVVTLLETALRIPAEFRGKVCFVFFDNEEAGLLGSAGFQKKYHKFLKDKPVINFDCVGDGDTILFAVNKKAKVDDAFYDLLQESMKQTGKKTILFEKASSVFYPSDQMNFKKSVAVAAFKKSKVLGCYMNKIHTSWDVNLDEENILFLANGMVKLCQNL